MRSSQMTPEQLVDELVILSAKEATWTPKANGRGDKTFQAITDKRSKIEAEILRRLNVTK